MKLTTSLKIPEKLHKFLAPEFVNLLNQISKEIITKNYKDEIIKLESNTKEPDFTKKSSVVTFDTDTSLTNEEPPLNFGVYVKLQVYLKDNLYQKKSKTASKKKKVK